MLKRLKNRKRFVKCLVLGMFVPLHSWALQIKPVQNNETVSAFVSQMNKTQIFVTRDRITALRGTPGAYTIVNDDVNGQVFLTPTTDFQKKPFSLFITTESGKTYGLQLIPKNSLSDSIELKPLTVNKVVAEHWEMSSAYENALVVLMRAMVNGTSPPGYSVTTISNSKINRLSNGATLQLKRVYQGAHLHGEIYQLINRSDHPIRVRAQDVYRPHIRALSMTQKILPIGGSTWIYGVTSHE